MSELAAVIFDLDGVIADTEPIFQEGLRRFLAPDALTDELYASIVGFSSHDTWLWVQATYDRTQTVEELREASREFIEAAFAAAVIEPIAGIHELVAALRDTSCLLGVASQSAPAWVTRVLEAASLLDAFDVVVTASEVANPKPAPDIYLHAAARLGVAPASCVAVEDSPTGVRAAHAAGMTVVQLRQGKFAPQPHALATHIVNSHHEFPLSLVQSSAAADA